MLILHRSRMSILVYRPSIYLTKEHARTKLRKDRKGNRTIENLMEGGENEPS